MDEEAEIDELFGKLAVDKANEVNALLRIGNMRGTAPAAHVNKPLLSAIFWPTALMSAFTLLTLCELRA